MLWKAFMVNDPINVLFILKDRETLFQAHIEEMNEKTLEKLDVKQT